MNRKTLVLIASLSALVIVSVSAWYFLAPHGSESPDAGERKILYWTDPMVPGYKSDKPGKSPFMDMELVPVYADEAGAGGPPAVTVQPGLVQKLGVRTATVTRAAASRTLNAHGYLFRHDGALVAIAIVVLGRWHPAGVGIASLLGDPDALRAAGAEEVWPSVAAWLAARSGSDARRPARLGRRIAGEGVIRGRPTEPHRT